MENNFVAPRGMRGVVFGIALGWAAMAAAVLAARAASPAATAGATPYVVEEARVRLTLSPSTGRLEARAVLALGTSPGRASDAEREGPLQLELHADLTVETAEVSGTGVEVHRREESVPAAAAKGEGPGEGETLRDAGVPTAVWEIGWHPPPGGRGELVLTYSGRLRQEVAVGEKPGEIHNFDVRAHIGEDGIHLADSGVWVPRLPGPEADREPDPEAPRTELRPLRLEVAVREIPGYVLIAAGDRSVGEPEEGWTTWRTPYPVSGPVLHGGRLQEHRLSAGEVVVRALVTPEAAPHTDRVLAAVKGYLELYEPLLGPYPYREMAVVENFFSSGFAYPGFTLLGPGVLEMGEGALRPGYLDHELLHNWWGNGVLVSELDGNWGEALTSWCANYMRPVLEGRPEAARTLRRDTVQQLSRSEDLKPLGEFGLPQGPGNLVGYQKGALVFAQLAGEIGEAVLWRSLRRFFRQQQGRVAGWKELRRAVEAESGRDLEAFFELWVRRGELPRIAVLEARWRADSRTLELTIERGGPSVGSVSLPLQVDFAGEAVEREVRLEPGGQTVELAFPEASEPPRWVEIDAQYRLPRQLPAELLMPTLSALYPPRPLTVFRMEDASAGYRVVEERLRRRWKKDDAERFQVQSGEFDASKVAAGHSLVLGAAARSDAARELLEEAGVSLEEAGFRVEGDLFGAPGDALLACRRIRREPGAVVCFFLANGEEALGRAYLLPFYGGNSLIVFRDGAPHRRRDFEAVERVEVTP